MIVSAGPPYISAFELVCDGTPEKQEINLLISGFVQVELISGFLRSCLRRGMIRIVSSMTNAPDVHCV